MDIGEYISARRAYNIVRRNIPSEQRLSFEELSILALLDFSSRPLSVSEVASWQHALHPTMAHRASRLAALSLICRSKGLSDRRKVICSITDEGIELLEMLCSRMHRILARGKVLSRIDAERVKRYVLAIGQHYMRASDLILLDLAIGRREGVPIALLVESLGIPQPTLSMSVQALEDRHLVERVGLDAKAAKIQLTDRGRLSAEELIVRIEDLIVKRKMRRSVWKSCRQGVKPPHEQV